MAEIPVIVKKQPKYEERMEFTIEQCDVSLVNAIRRTILSDIPTFVFKTFPHAENDVYIMVNTSRQNNEILKQRFSCIPIYLTDFTLPYREALFEIDVTNTTKEIIYVTTDDITVRHVPSDDSEEIPPLNKELLSKMDSKKLFPHDPITNSPIVICRLKPSVSKGMEGQSLKLSAKISISTAKYNGCYNVVNTCSFSNTTDITAANMAWEQNVVKQTYDTPEQQDKERENWMLLEGKRYFKDRSFEFVLESLGIYKNEILIKTACKIMVEKLSLFREMNEITIKDSETTIAKSKDIISPLDYSIGKLLEYFIYKIYYENSKEIVYVNFFKEHPHNTNSILRIAIKAESELTLEVMIPNVSDVIIEYLTKVSNLF